jgi:hypothetical protein
MVKLDRGAGPECPECGCNHCELSERKTRWGGTAQQYECTFCHTIFSPRVPKAPKQKRSANERR